MPIELDRVDIQILNLLQDDASIPLRKLAGQVHASAATCQRRIAQLRATQFYSACFEPLGYTLQHQDSGQVIYGADGVWSFCLYPATGDAALAGHRSHVAVSAPSQQAVRAFFDRAASGGAATLREPSLRPDINERYYGAMITDPDGHTIEVVHWSAAR